MKLTFTLGRTKISPINNDSSLFRKISGQSI